MKIYRDFIII